MGFLVSLLAPRLGQTFAKLIAYVGVPLLLLALLWWRVDAWGDRRYDAGVEATDARWQKASDQLKAEAARSATQADDAAAQRFEERAEQVRDEQERLDEAERTGSSPLDVLFGG
jgi:hypothetical protein